MGIMILRLFSAGSAHAHCGLEGIIDPPLEACTQGTHQSSHWQDEQRRRTGKGTNHDHTRAKTLCCEIAKANLANNRAETLALVLRLAELRDERVCRVGDYSANNTREVARAECDTKLGRLAIRILWLSEDVGIEKLDNLLEEEELGHRVRDLTRRIQRK